MSDSAGSNQSRSIPDVDQSAACTVTVRRAYKCGNAWKAISPLQSTSLKNGIRHTACYRHTTQTPPLPVQSAEHVERPRNLPQHCYASLVVIAAALLAALQVTVQNVKLRLVDCHCVQDALAAARAVQFILEIV